VIFLLTSRENPFPSAIDITTLTDRNRQEATGGLQLPVSHNTTANWPNNTYLVTYLEAALTRCWVQ
jgi:hypothetical protein